MNGVVHKPEHACFYDPRCWRRTCAESKETTPKNLINDWQSSIKRSAMKARRTYLVIILPLLTLLICGCASPLKPSAEMGNQESVTVPFKVRGAMLSFGGHPVIEASINGVSGSFLIEIVSPNAE